MQPTAEQFEAFLRFKRSIPVVSARDRGLRRDRVTSERLQEVEQRSVWFNSATLIQPLPRITRPLCEDAFGRPFVKVDGAPDEQTTGLIARATLYYYRLYRRYPFEIVLSKPHYGLCGAILRYYYPYPEARGIALLYEGDPGNCAIARGGGRI